MTDDGTASAAAPATATVKSADRALAVVEYVAGAGSVSFTELIEHFGLPRSSAHGLLRTLIASGWIEHTATTRLYSLGLRAWQVGQQYSGHRELATIAKPIMDRLAAELGETVQLARLDGIENVYIAISHSPRPMRLASSVGMRLHAHATGIGKALLSMLPPAEAEDRLREVVLPKLTENTVTDVDRILGLLERTRESGFALDDEEFVSGCRCVAVPLTASGGLLSAISVTMPTSQTDERWPASIHAPLEAAAEEIRARLGVAAPQLPRTA